MMIGLEPVKRFIILLIFSSYVKNEEPVSGLIIAEPEHGKTKLLKSIRAKRVEVIMDATAYGISQHLLPRIFYKEVRTLIFPDFLRILSRGKRIVDEILTLINAIIEDGIDASILTKNIQWIPPSSESVKANVIIAITPNELEKRKEKLRRYGFMRRVLPFYYTYTQEDLKLIHEALKTGTSNQIFEKIELKVPNEDGEIYMSKELADMLDPVIEILKPVIGAYTGFTLRRQLQCLCKANALMNNRTKVTEDDIKEILAFVPFLFNPIAGDECIWLIMRNLPARSEELVSILSNRFSRRTIYDRLEKLRNLGLIYKAKDLWKSILFN